MEVRISGETMNLASPTLAFQNGADYIVVGRPIRDAPDPRAAAERVQERIQTLFGSPRE
ncbi:MAG: orotidine 5'-phosphate decarboxylase / HUMPS family protein [Gammaproteobacteria bacterium]